ncbi:hypothetical protein [Acidiphilium sp.]|uniref:hypothetical protein n=1 Tax=Acidiphilium sp. TaxID=527 RepID=UPI003D058707
MTDHTIDRRACLKGALLGVTGTMLANAGLRSAQASSKATKAQAGYIDHPAPGGARCTTCTNYIPAGSMCQQVAGVVSPNGFCNYYVPKS